MMPVWKKNIFTRVIKRRIERGEVLEDIMSSYPALSFQEKEEVIQNL